MTEENLRATKYWDYRLLSSDNATMMFIYAYGKRVPHYNERRAAGVSIALKNGSNRFCLGGKYMNILKTFDVTNPKAWNNWTTAQRLRRFCDSLGMRYEEFWSWACELHEDIGIKTTFMTSFGSNVMLRQIAKKQHESRKNIIPVSKHPFFMSEGYKGCAIQDEYYEWLLTEVVKKYGLSSKSIVTEMIRDGIFSPLYFARKRETSP